MTKEEFIHEMKRDKEFREAVRDVLSIEVITKVTYTLAELSTITGLTERALKGRRSRGKIRMFNDGNEVLITAAEVERYVAWLNSKI